MSPHQPDAEQTTAPPQTRTVPAKNELYPNYRGMIIGEDIREADEFDLLREQLLEGYGYNTARAYWGDLEHWRDWCEDQDSPFHPFDSTTEQIDAYLKQMAVDGYSPNTRARRLTAIRTMCEQAVRAALIDGNPTLSVGTVKRRKRQVPH